MSLTLSIVATAILAWLTAVGSMFIASFTNSAGAPVIFACLMCVVLAAVWL